MSIKANYIHVTSILGSHSCCLCLISVNLSLHSIFLILPHLPIITDKRQGLGTNGIFIYSILDCMQPERKFKKKSKGNAIISITLNSILLLIYFVVYGHCYSYEKTFHIGIKIEAQVQTQIQEWENKKSAFID